MKKIIIGTLVVSALMMNTGFAVFSDVPETYWAYTAIEKMQNDGILSGYVDGTFRPNNNISLAEFATIFTKIFEVPKDNVSNYFTEISKNHWAKGSIEAVRKYINPYVYRKLLGQVKNYQKNELRNILRKLVELDVKSKKGEVDLRVGLEVLLTVWVK